MHYSEELDLEFQTLDCIYYVKKTKNNREVALLLSIVWDMLAFTLEWDIILHTSIITIFCSLLQGDTGTPGAKGEPGTKGEVVSTPIVHSTLYKSQKHAHECHSM